MIKNRRRYIDALPWPNNWQRSIITYPNNLPLSTLIPSPPSLPDAGIKWFLATDNYATRVRAKQLFGDRVVFRNVTIERKSAEGVISGLVDMWLMSLCDDLIVSAASTYGKIAFGLRGKNPKSVSRRSVCIQVRAYRVLII